MLFSFQTREQTDEVIRSTESKAGGEYAQSIQKMCVWVIMLISSECCSDVRQHQQSSSHLSGTGHLMFCEGVHNTKLHIAFKNVTRDQQKRKKGALGSQ